MYAIVKQMDVSESSRVWAELNCDETTGAVWVNGYRTRKEAVAKMKSMVPAGKDPSVYAGLRVVKTWNSIVLV